MQSGLGKSKLNAHLGFHGASLSSMSGDSGGRILVDLFNITGQSNAEGRGDSTLSPIAMYGRFFSAGSITAPLVDPVGGATTGSMWPSLSNEWYNQTKYISIFVESAKGGSALLAAADDGNGNWSPTGTLRAAAVSNINTAIQAINNSPIYKLRNVYFIYDQGETESQAINGTTITGPLYNQALQDLGTFFKAQVPEMTIMGVIRTGNKTPRSQESGWADIRTAQEAACTASANLRMLYRGAASFPTSGMNLMKSASDVHYSQTGYNMAGKCAAIELAKVVETPPLSAPSLLASQVYSDTSWVTKTSQTRSHTTNASTKCLVVAVPAVRGGSSATSVGTCTFNGVSMQLVNVQGQQGAASPVALNGIAGIFYLNESTYGSTLGGVTANLVQTPQVDQSLLSLVALDLDVEVNPDNSVAGTVTIATGSTIPIAITTDNSAFIVAVAAFGASGASVPTATITGITELMDAGGTRPGGDRSGAGCVGYATATSAVDNDYSGTFSANVTGAQLVAAFRAKISGE